MESSDDDQRTIRRLRSARASAAGKAKRAAEMIPVLRAKIDTETARYHALGRRIKAMGGRVREV